MFGYFCVTALSQWTARNCSDIRFCRDNIQKANKWSINKEKAGINKNVFEAPLLKDDKETPYILSIYKIINSGFRFRIIFPGEKSSSRYDLTNEEIIINSTSINNIGNVEYAVGEMLQIKAGNLIVDIKPSPLELSIQKRGKTYITLNSENFLLIEDNSPTDNEIWEGFVDVQPHGAEAVGIDFSFMSKEARLHGLAEGPNEFNIEDTNSQPFRRNAFDAWPKYGSVPLVLAHCSDFIEQAGVFWMNPTDTFFDIKTTENKRSVHVISESGFIDLVLFVAPITDIFKQYSLLTGTAPLPPLFSLGYHQSKWGYYSQEFVENVSSKLDSYDIPHDCLWIDIDHLYKNQPFTIDKTIFPDLPGLANKLSLKHRFLVRITDPHIPVDDNHPAYVVAKEKGYFVRSPKGEQYIGSCWPGNSSWPDFTRKEVREWWASLYKEMEGYLDNVYPWNDMNEASVFDEFEGTFPKGNIFGGDKENRELHNVYGVLMVASSFDGLRKRDLRPFILSRSFFSGIQKWSWVWSGDNYATWHDLKYSIETSVNSALSGIPYTGSDIGGYRGDINDELTARWYQVSMLTQPFFREHSENSTVFHEPYTYADKNESVFRAIKGAIIDRYRLLGVWYTAAHRNSETNEPLVLPLWVLYGDSDYADNKEQFILARRILGAPVLNKGDTFVFVTKPPGRWFEWKTGTELLKSEEVEADIETVHAYLMGGTISPMFDQPKESTYETVRTPITLYVALDEKGKASGDLYLDDGRSYAYQNGDFIHSKFEYDNGHIHFHIIGGKPTFQTPNVTKIVVYGSNEKPEISIPDANVTFDKNILVIQNISLSITNETDFDNKKSEEPSLWLVVGLPVIAVAIVAVTATIVIVRRRKRSSEPLLTQENAGDEKYV